MLHDETERVKTMKNEFAYLNYKLFEEMKWFLEYSADRDAKQFGDMCQR